MLEQEIGDAARNLASGEIDKLAVRERYLQLIYEGLESDDGGGNPRSPDQACRQRCVPNQSSRTSSIVGARPPRAGPASGASSGVARSDEPTPELQSLICISYAVSFLQKNKHKRLQ